MSTVKATPLFAVTRASGGVTTEYQGCTLMRHFGDPAAEYKAATEGLAIFDRSHRGRLVITGQAPGRMLGGILTGRIPDPPSLVAEGLLGGLATYHGVLTSKGRMITDLWAVLTGAENEAGFLLDIPVAGVAGLIGNLQKFLPPRFAIAEDVSDALGMITVVGPEAAGTLSRLALSLRVEAGDLTVLQEGAWRLMGPDLTDGLLVMKSEEVWPEAYSVLGAAEALQEFWRTLVDDGAVPAGLGVWSTLRVEAGRPVFGTDMDEQTIPIEAGIHKRAIDYEKGCFTGQEVIIRIRDRGHVNRRLRWLRLGDVPTPRSGAELCAEDSDKVVGFITSAVQSPKFGEVLGLAYVREGFKTVTLQGRVVKVPQE
ncbi:MAG TPA: aminomethyl transferase family protein [Gemmatimonadetes bacterium]|nr:aminomethyl transferase family protein [Gemmatimonadota bacterium]